MKKTWEKKEKIVIISSVAKKQPFAVVKLNEKIFFDKAVLFFFIKATCNLLGLDVRIVCLFFFLCKSLIVFFLFGKHVILMEINEGVSWK